MHLVEVRVLCVHMITWKLLQISALLRSYVDLRKKLGRFCMQDHRSRSKGQGHFRRVQGHSVMLWAIQSRVELPSAMDSFSNLVYFSLISGLVPCGRLVATGHFWANVIVISLLPCLNNSFAFFVLHFNEFIHDAFSFSRFTLTIRLRISL